MSVLEQNLPLKMVRATLHGMPEFALPAGFSLRWYQPGDEAHWRRIQVAAERFLEITPELFRKQFAVESERGLQPASTHEPGSGISPALLAERQCYVLDPRGEVIGTGTAWFGDRLEEASQNKLVNRTQAAAPSPPDEGRRRGPGRGGALQPAPLSDSLPARSSRGERVQALRSVGRETEDRVRSLNHSRWGRVHWMAMLPEFQGLRLGQALLTAICRRLRELGHERAFLHTSAARIAAIRLYLKFGFEPVFRNEEEKAAWRNLFAALRRTR